NAPEAGEMLVDGVQSEPIELGRMEILREGSDGAILAYGNMVETAIEASDILRQRGLHVEVVNARFVKPLDEELILELARRGAPIVTVEEAQRSAGFGSAVAELLQDREVDARLVSIGIGDEFVQHAKPDIQHRATGLTAEAIAARVSEILRTTTAVAMRPTA
ncbi:MAG TPA: transketolase C-terminal domain-containing protein, partial [bacterium]|nr:transketolase C-terminal domain-containing protein [bacterium]